MASADSPSVTDVILIDTLDGMKQLVGELHGLPNDPAALFFDLEGTELSRNGIIAIFSLFVLPLNKTYLIDIHVLGMEGFIVQDENGTSLKSIMEAPDIPKVCFDIRNDNDALHGLFGIKVQGIIDIQLLQLATRTQAGSRLSGLGSCIQYDSMISAEVKQEWEKTKTAGVNLFAPEKGGKYEVFIERPLSPTIVQYCANDVTFLPVLLNVYRLKLDQFWRYMIRNGTAERIRESRRPGYIAHGEHKSQGPWREGLIRRRRKAWKKVCSMNLMAGCVIDKNDHWRAKNDPVEGQVEVPKDPFKLGIVTLMSVRDGEDLYDGLGQLRS